MTFKFKELQIKDLILIERKLAKDNRGFFSKIFDFEVLKSIGWMDQVKQINHTYTKKTGTIRGLHYQENPYNEMKVVNVLHGEIYDVAVDLRPHSSTFLKWHGEVLSQKNNRSLFIPKGFAHGFQTLTDDVEILYYHSNHYSKEAEQGLNFLDPILSISWPIKVSEISKKDLSCPMINKDFKGIKNEM
jgi:dTDP-4-dehydrorhamnose 3,5-epimerase